MCHHNAAMAKSWLKITVRMPPALHAKLTEATGDHMPPNSLNTEIIERLDRSFEQEEVLLGYVRTEMKEIEACQVREGQEVMDEPRLETIK
jgi:hypothetical protein